MSDNQVPFLPTPAKPFDFGAGALGGLNALAFGLPEAALKALGDEKQKQVIEAYKAAHPEYGIGETAGTIGSMFIPGGAILKGAGGLAKLAGMAGAGEKLAGLGAKAASSPGLVQGLTAAAEQAVPRAFGSQEEGKDVGQRALDVLGSEAIGTGLGGALGFGGKVLQHLPKRIMEEIDESANAQILAPIFGKSLTRAVRQTVKNNKSAIGQIEDIEDIMGGMVNELEKFGVRSSQQAKDLVGENGLAWRAVDKAANDAVKAGKLENIGNKPLAMMQSPDVAYSVTRWGKPAQKAIDDIAGQIKRTTKDPMSVFAQTRSVLNDEIETGFKSTTPEGRIRGQVAQAMKNYFDDAAIKAAPDAPDLKALKSIWPYYVTMGKALAREKGIIAPAFTPGSKTFTSFVSSGLLEKPQDLLKVGAGSLVGGIMEKVSPMVGNVIGSEGARFIKKILPRETPGDILSAPKEIELPPALAKLLGITGKSVTAAGERGKMLAPEVQNLMASGPQDQTASLSPEPQVAMLQPMPIDAQQVPVVAQQLGQVQQVPQVQQVKQAPEMVDNAINRAWSLEDPNGLIESNNPQAKQDFVNSLKAHVLKTDGSIDYRKASKLLFAGQSDKAKDFSEAYDAYDKIQKGLPSAVKGIGTLLDSKAEAEKQLVKDTVVGLLKKRDGMDSKLAESKVNDIIDSLDKPGVKTQKLLTLIKLYDERFQPGGVLEQAGIMLKGTE